MSPPIVVPLAIPFATRVVNAYLLTGDPVTIVDSGVDWDESASELEAALAHHGLAYADLEQIVITHQHYDHAGFAHRLQALSGAHVIAHHQVVSHLAGLGRASAESEDLYQAEVMRIHGVPEDRIAELFEKSRANRKYGSPVHVDRPVREGDVVEAGGSLLTVFERPGHSPSDLIFVEQEGRFAFVGDHLIAGISPNPIVHGPLDRPADPRNRTRALVSLLDSMDKTAALDFEVALSGHGAQIDDHVQLISDRRVFHERRKQKMFDLLGDSSLTAREIAFGIWRERADSEAFLTLSETLGHLDVLEDEGRVTPVEGTDGIVRYNAQ